MGAELPVCEEFAGDENITCVRGDSSAVIASMTEEGKSLEFWRGDRKAYMEVSKDGHVYASSGWRHLEVMAIPAEDAERYLAEVLESLMDDIAWK